MAKPRASAVKAKSRKQGSSDAEAPDASKTTAKTTAKTAKTTAKTTKKSSTAPRRDEDAVKARERARQRSGADD